MNAKLRWHAVTATRDPIRTREACFNSGAAHRRPVLQAIIPMPDKHRIFRPSVTRVYPFYVAKAEKKGRTKSEVDAIIRWLTGYSQRELEAQLEKQTDFETFFKKAPKPNPLRSSIKGV